MSIVIVTVILVLLGGLGFGFKTLTLATGSGQKHSPDSPPRYIPPGLTVPPTPAASSTATTTPGPEFTRIADICGLVPESTSNRLVGAAAKKADRNPSAWTCRWSADQRDGRRHTQRALDLDISVRSTDLSGAGTRSATYEFAQDRAHVCDRMSHAFASECGPYADLPGVGDEAYSTYTVTEALLKSGTGTVMVRIRNAIITVDYGGSTSQDDPNGFPDLASQKPLADDPTRKGAEQTAREVAKALVACTPCTG